MKIRPRFSLGLLLHTVLLLAAAGAVWSVWSPWQRALLIQADDFTSDLRYKLTFIHGSGTFIKPGFDSTGKARERVENEIIVHNLETQKELWRVKWAVPGSKNDARATFSPCGRWVESTVIAHDGFYSNVFKTTDGTSPLDGDPYCARTVTFSADKKWFAILYSDLKRPADIFDAATGKKHATLQIPKDMEVEFSAKSSFFPVFTDSTLVLADTRSLEFSISDGRFLRLYREQDPSPTYRLKSPDGRLALGAGKNETLVMDATSGAKKYWVSGNNWITEKVFSAGSSMFVTHLKKSDGTASVLLWQSSDGKKLRALPGELSYGDVFSADGKTLVTLTKVKDSKSNSSPMPEVVTLHVWNVETGTLQRSIQFGPTTTAVYVYFLAPDTHSVFVCDHDSAKTLDLRDGSVVKSWLASCHLSEDRQRIAISTNLNYGVAVGGPYFENPGIADAVTGEELFRFTCSENMSFMSFQSNSRVFFKSNSVKPVSEVWIRVRDESSAGLLACPQVWIALLLTITWILHLRKVIVTRPSKKSLSETG